MTECKSGLLNPVACSMLKLSCNMFNMVQLGPGSPIFSSQHHLSLHPRLIETIKEVKNCLDRIPRECKDPNVHQEATCRCKRLKSCNGSTQPLHREIRHKGAIS